MLTVNNTNSLTLLNILNGISTDQSRTLEQLSTGSRINRGGDDPAGFLALQSVESELNRVDAAIANNSRTSALLNVADEALGEIVGVLQEIQSLAVASTNGTALSPDEVAANQSQIDNAISAIDRIVGSTRFNGQQLLDGALSINVQNTNSDKVFDARVFSVDPSSTDTTLNIVQDRAASQATFASDLGADGFTGSGTFTIQGRDGVATIEVASNDVNSTIAAQINAQSAVTGVTARSSGTQLIFESRDLGGQEFVRVNKITGNGNEIADNFDEGRDANITVNGQIASVDGTSISFSSGDLSLQFNVSEAFATAGAGDTATLTVQNVGGATFQLGPNAETRTTLGIAGIFSNQLGNGGLGYLSEIRSGGGKSLLDDPGRAADIAEAALEQVTAQAGRLGGFQRFQVDTTNNALTAIQEGLNSAKSTIADVDFAAATAELSKQQVLQQSAISLLGLANQQTSSILSLLR